MTADSGGKQDVPREADGKWKPGQSANPGTQFTPGQSGNPAGRPAGGHNLSWWIRKLMEDESFEQKLKDGTVVKGAPIEAIIKTAVAKGMSGSKEWADWLARYGYGTKVDITSGGHPIPILGGASVSAATDPDTTGDEDDPEAAQS